MDGRMGPVFIAVALAETLSLAFLLFASYEYRRLLRRHTAFFRGRSAATDSTREWSTHRTSSDMPSPAPANGETLIRILSQHWIKYVFPVFVYCMLFAVSLLLFALAGLAADDAAWLSHLAYIAALTLFLVTHHWFFLMLLCESAAHIVVTNHRIVWMHERLFVDEQMREYAFDKMKTVEARKRGVLQTVLRYGTLQFESGMDIPLVPHPNNVAKDIEQAMGLR